MKPVICKFEYQDGNGGEDHGKIKVFERVIEFPERAPMAFHAINQWGYEVFTQEKLALKRRIEELEERLKLAIGLIPETHMNATIALLKKMLDDDGGKK